MEMPIPLSQKIFLLAIHPEKGGIISSAYSAIDFAVIGSLFMELYLLKKIRFENKRIVVVNSKSDNAVHHMLLERMTQSKSPRRISTWISRFNLKMKVIRGGVQQGLLDKRLIKMEPKRFLFFRWTIPSIMDKKTVIQLEREVKDWILKGTDVEEQLILLSFVEPAGLLYRLFPDRQKRKDAKKRLKQMMVANGVSAAVADAISASQAVAASVAVSAAATSAATS